MVTGNPCCKVYISKDSPYIASCVVSLCRELLQSCMALYDEVSRWISLLYNVHV